MPDKTTVADLLDANLALRQDVGCLTDKVDLLADSTVQLAASDQRQRNGLIALGVGGVIVALIVVALAVLFWEAERNYDRAGSAISIAEQINRSRLVSCEAGNAERAVTKQVLATILTTAYEPAEGDPPMSAEDKRELRQFLNLIEKAYQPRDCQAAIVTGPGRS